MAFSSSHYFCRRAFRDQNSGLSARRTERKPSYSRALLEGAAQSRTNNCLNRGPMARSLTHINPTSRPSSVGRSRCCRRFMSSPSPFSFIFLLSHFLLIRPIPSYRPSAEFLLRVSFCVTHCLEACCGLCVVSIRRGYLDSATVFDSSVTDLIRRATFLHKKKSLCHDNRTIDRR